MLTLRLEGADAFARNDELQVVLPPALRPSVLAVHDGQGLRPYTAAVLAALDPRQRQHLWTFITTLIEAGTSVVFATHDIAEAERHADRVLVLADGELLFDGTPTELRSEAGAVGRLAIARP